MSIFVRNHHREALQPKNSKGEWYSVTLADLVCLHVYTKTGHTWNTKITGTVTTEGGGFRSREEAETFILRVARKRLESALRELAESEAANG